MNATEFRQRMAALPEPVTDKRPPFWEAWRWDLWRRAQIDDPHNFTLWPCVYHTMLVEHWPQPILYEFEAVRDFLPVLSIEFSRAEYNNLIHQAYHIHQWQQATGRRIDQLGTIVEFGGGYGAMRLLCHRLGFKGRYIIYDLPEFSLLQEWYLSQYGPETEWNPKREPKDVDLFMALYSLSEVEPGQRNDMIPKAKSYLFLYSGKWEEWDNDVFFQKIIPRAIKMKWQELNWRHSELAHLPDKNNWYSIGW